MKNSETLSIYDLRLDTLIGTRDVVIRSVAGAAK